MIAKETISVLILAIYICNHGDCYCVTMNDGCSVPLSAPFPYKTDFRPACRKHDICYRCVSFSHLFDCTFLIESSSLVSHPYLVECLISLVPHLTMWIYNRGMSFLIGLLL